MTMVNNILFPLILTGIRNIGKARLALKAPNRSQIGAWERKYVRGLKE